MRSQFRGSALRRVGPLDRLADGNVDGRCELAQFAHCPGDGVVDWSLAVQTDNLAGAYSATPPAAAPMAAAKAGVATASPDHSRRSRHGSRWHLPPNELHSADGSLSDQKLPKLPNISSLVTKYLVSEAFELRWYRPRQARIQVESLEVCEVADLWRNRPF